MTTHDISYYEQEMKSQPFLVKVLKSLGVMKIYADGDVLSSCFRRYHPLYWVVWIFMLPVCLYWGIKIAKESLPTKPSPWFDDKEILWL